MFLQIIIQGIQVKKQNYISKIYFDVLSSTVLLPD